MNISQISYQDRIRYIVALEHINKTNINDMPLYDNQIRQYCTAEKTPKYQELKKSLNDAYEDTRNIFSHILHESVTIDNSVFDYLLYMASKIDEDNTKTDLQSNNFFTEKGLLFFISLRSSKATMYKLLDKIASQTYKNDPSFFTHYAIRDGYNISRDTGQSPVTEWTLYCNIIDYLRRPIKDTKRTKDYATKRDDTATKKDEKSEFDIRPSNKYAFDNFCLQWLSLQNEITVEFARSISTQCDKKLKWIKRPYFKGKNAENALKELNNFRSTENEAEEVLEFEQCETHRTKGDCYIIKLPNEEPILLYRHFLKFLLVETLDGEDVSTKINVKFEELYDLLKDIKDKHSTVDYDRYLPKSIRRNTTSATPKSIEQRFHARNIHTGNRHTQAQFIIWSLQHPIVKKENIDICLDKKEYQELLHQILESDNVTATIKDFLYDKKQTKIKSIGKYIKTSIKGTVSNLCTIFKKWIKNKEPEYKKLLKIKGQRSKKTIETLKSTIKRPYAQPIQIIMGKMPKEKIKDNKKEIGNKYKRASENQGTLIWQNYWNIDSSKIHNREHLKVELSKSNPDGVVKKLMKEYAQNSSTFCTDKVLLILANNFFNKYVDENSIKLINTSNTIDTINFKISDKIISIKHIGKPYMKNKDLFNLIERASNKQKKDKNSSNRTIISYMEQILAEERKNWYLIGEKILEIENAIVKNPSLKLNIEGKRYLDFSDICQHLSISEDEKNKIVKIRNRCFHIDILSQDDIDSKISKQEVFDLINKLCEEVKIPKIELKKDKKNAHYYKKTRQNNIFLLSIKRSTTVSALPSGVSATVTPKIGAK